MLKHYGVSTKTPEQESCILPYKFETPVLARILMEPPHTISPLSMKHHGVATKTPEQESCRVATNRRLREIP